MSVLDFARQVEPGFKDVPDDKLIEFIVSVEPEFLKDKPFRNLARATYAQQATDSQFRNELESELEQERNPFLSTAFGRSVTRGAGQMLEGLAGAGEAVGAATRMIGLGEDPGIRLGAAIARSFSAGERELPSAGPRSLSEVEGAGDLGALILERGVGEQIPNLVASAATSGAGLFTGLAPKAASILGALTTTFPVEMGSAFDEIKQLTGKEAPITAAGVGAVNAFLETFGDSKLIERALGGDQLVGNTVGQLLKNLATRTATQGAREAGVEAAQELTTALAPMLQGAEAPGNLGERLGTAAILGGAGGGVFSAGSDIGGLAGDAARTAIQNRRLEQAFTDLDQASPELDITRFDRANLPAGEAIPFERAGIPFERAGIPFERSGIPVERAGIPFQRQEIVPFERAQLPADEAIPVERQEIVPFDRAGIPVERQEIVPFGRITREQAGAIEMLRRMDADRQQAAAEATQLEQQGRTDLAILTFTGSLARRIDALVSLRQSPPLTPEATVGQAPGVVAPGAIPQEEPNAQTVRSDPGLTPPPGGAIEGSQVESRQDLPVQEPREITPPAQAPQAVRRGSYIAARESGDRFVIQMTPERIAAIEDMGEVDETETAEAMKADSRGMPTGSPKSNAGLLMQQMLAASAVVETMSERSGVQLDAEAKALMEKRYQEQALNQYVKAKQSGQPMQFSQREAYRAALKDASRLANTAGTLRGRVSTIEMPDEPGMVRPDVEEAAQVEQEDSRAEATLNFLDQFTSKAEREAVMNLIADALGVARPIENPSRAAERYMADPRLKQLVDEFTKTTELRFSLGSLVGSPMTVEQVTQAAAGILPDLSQVQIIDDPGLITADGVPIRAQYRPGEAKPYLLNAAFLGSEQQVREALLEELVHGVWNDPEVQAEWDAVKQQLTEGDLQSVAQYPEAVRVEEAANRKVLEADNLGLFDRLLNAIANAIQRIFGIDLKLYPARRILDKALRARSAGGEIRNSLARGVWKNAADARKDAESAGDPETILRAAAAQGTIVPPQYKAEMDALNVEGATREQLVQARLLKPVADSVEMGRLLGSNFAPVGPDGFTLASGMTLAPDAAQDIAAEAIVKQDLIFRRIRTQSQKLIERRSADLAEAIGRIPESAVAQNKADLYRQLSDRLVQDYRQYLTDQAMTMKQAGFDPQTQREIAAATSRVTEFYRGIANAVSNGLRAIAAEIPDAALADVNATRAWIEQRLNDPNQPRLMSDEARDWLLNPIGRFVAPIRRDPRLHKRLGAIREIAEGKKEALDRMLTFQRAMNKLGKKVNPQQFATRFAKLREQYRKEAEAVKEISWEIERAEGDVNGAEAANEFLNRMLADPEYQARVSEAVSGLQARHPVREYDVNDGQYSGRINYINPLTGQGVQIDLQPEIGTERKNVEAIAKLRDDVTTWMGSTDDPILRNAWQREIEWLERYAMIVTGGLTTGTFALGYRLPSAFQIGPFSRDLWRGRLELRGPAYQRIGNRVILPAHQAAIVAGQVDREIRKITDDFDAPVKGAALKAAQAHGQDSSPDSILNWYVPNVLEPIVTQAQNPTAVQYKVGDWIAPGIQVKKEDLDLAKILKKRNDALFAMLQNVEKDSPFGLLFYDPLQISESFAGKALSRRSTDYGLKMPRRPLSRENERGRTFVSNWISAPDGTVRMDQLRQNFDWVLMSNGLIGNTDSEFNPTLDDRDKKFFAEVRDRIRSNDAPQTLDELVELAGDMMQTDEVDASTAAAEFQLRLMGYVDTFVRNFNRSMDIVPTKAIEEFVRLQIPRGIIDSVGVGRNPFLTPRGQLVAPPSFYKNTALDDTSWGGLTTGVRSVMTLRELEAISAAEAAINKELERFENRLNGEIPTLQRQLKAQKAVRFGPFSAKRRVARSSRKRAEAGELMYDYLTLKDHRRAITALRSDLERLAREHVLLPEDNPAIQAVRNVRQGMSSALLQSIISIFNNTFGGSVANMLTRRSLGLWNLITTPVEMLWEGSRYTADAVISRLLKLPGVDQFTQRLSKTPGFRRLVRILIAEQLRHDQQKAFAEYARTVEPQNPAERAAVAKMFPQTYGRLTDEEVGPIAAAFNLFMTKIPGVARVAETSKVMFPGAIDRLLNQVTTNRIEGWVNQIEKAGLEAWAARDTGVEGWDDLANPLNKFVAKDLRLPSETSLAMWRNLLFPVGSLESITLDHYKRLKAENESQMLSPGQLAQVSQEFLKKTNMADSSATPTMFQGRGWSGEIRKSIFMLMRYMTNFSSVQENIAGRVYGDTSKAAIMWRIESNLVAALLTLLILSFGKELGQEARQVVTGDPRTAQPITALMQDPSVEDFGRYVGTSMASILPFIGERITQAFGGTSNRPMLDASKMVAPLGLIADVEQALKRTVQTGDAGYPLADLIRRYIPLSSAVINRMIPGEVETREASRALRLAAPADIDIRESGSSTTSRQTPNTPIMRTAIRKAMAGDQEGAKEALDQAVRLRVEAGQSEADARSSVAAAFQARDPERTTFGRMLTAEERRRTLARMTDRQRTAYLRSRRVFDSQLFGSSKRRRRISARRRRSSLARRGARASRPRSL